MSSLYQDMPLKAGFKFNEGVIFEERSMGSRTGGYLEDPVTQLRLIDNIIILDLYIVNRI
jgi:hypothetical protein